MRKYIAIDLGSSNGRIIVGNLKEIKVVYRFPNRVIRIRDSYFWDILSIFNEIKIGLTLAFRQYSGQITSIGIDSCALDYGLLDSQGDLIGNIYHYRDRRTDNVPEKLFKIISKREIFEETGTQFMQINTLYQLYAQRLEKSNLLDCAQSILTTSSLIVYWLTGSKKNEFSYATTMQLYNARDKDWSSHLLGILGIKKEQLGDVIPSGTVIGPLLPEIATEIGADNGVSVIVPATHDTGSAVAAIPAIGNTNYAYLSSGTWSLLGIESLEPIITDRSYEYNFTNEGGADGGIRFLKNIIGLWMIQECKRYWDGVGLQYSYSELWGMAGEAGASELNLDVSDPRFIKLGVPGDSMVDRIRNFAKEEGLYYSEQPGFIVRAILEGLVSVYSKTIQDIYYVTGQSIDSLHIIGGGCQNELLCRLSADVTGIPVIAGPVEATAVGNIMVQAIATEEIKSIVEGRKIIRENFVMKEYHPG